jgi:hypothetical protein
MGSERARNGFSVMEARLGRHDRLGRTDAPATGDRRARAEALAAGLLVLRQAVERGTLA